MKSKSRVPRISPDVCRGWAEVFSGAPMPCWVKGLVPPAFFSLNTIEFQTEEVMAEDAGQEEQKERDGDLREPWAVRAHHEGDHRDRIRAPTPIQEKTIPPMLAGREPDRPGATGTGKTAAFAIPILEKIDITVPEVQALCSLPPASWRSRCGGDPLLFQVTSAASGFCGLGGQPIQLQLKRLDRGVHVVVGTPGRIMDHLRRGSLRLDAVRVVVLDEADEMLRMGFIEDVEWILSQAPEGRQTALFSATLPREVRRIAERPCANPLGIEIEHKTNGARHRAALSPCRAAAEAGRPRPILETETDRRGADLHPHQDGAAELTERLQGRGYAAEAMHGDMNQAQREDRIRRLKAGQVEIVVAPMSPPRLDVERISHVVNYDIPTMSRLRPPHRPHRPGGRSGSPCSSSPRERRMITEIERYNRPAHHAMKMPNQATWRRGGSPCFKDNIRSTVEEGDLDLYLSVVRRLVEEGSTRRGSPPPPPVLPRRQAAGGRGGPRPERIARTEDGMVRLFIDAGSRAGVRPGDIVGAIANEAGVPARRSARSTSTTTSLRRAAVAVPRPGAPRMPAPPSAAGRWRSGGATESAGGPTSAGGIAGRRPRRIGAGRV